MSPEDEHASAQISGLELLRSGVTCFMEPGTAFDTDAVADAVVGVGIRASLSEPFLWDISGSSANRGCRSSGRPRSR